MGVAERSHRSESQPVITGLVLQDVGRCLVLANQAAEFYTIAAISAFFSAYGGNEAHIWRFLVHNYFGHRIQGDRVSRRGDWSRRSACRSSRSRGWIFDTYHSYTGLCTSDRSRSSSRHGGDGMMLPACDRPVAVLRDETPLRQTTSPAFRFCPKIAYRRRQLAGKEPD